MIIVLITGSRKYKKYDLMFKILSRFDPKKTRLVHGACPTGADKMADEIGKSLGFDIQPYEADWDRFGYAAGPIRNREMVDKESPDIALAFHIDKKLGKGTKDCIDYCIEKKVPYFVFI